MATKPIDRLLFAQGGDCFFCKPPLSKSEASLEHLVAQTHGGKDNDENLVVCCKTLNILFGRMSLKEKLEVILKQRGGFYCPAQAGAPEILPVKTAPPKPIKPQLKPGTPLALVVQNLNKRGNAKPTTVEKLLNTIQSVLEHQGLDVAHSEKMLGQLRSNKWIIVQSGKVSYCLPNGKKDG